MLGQQVWVRRRGRQQHRRGRRERTCAGVQCAVRRKVKHDAWMNDLFLGRNSNLSHAHMSSVLCDLCSDCTCENVARGKCICLHLHVVAPVERTCRNVSHAPVETMYIKSAKERQQIHTQALHKQQCHRCIFTPCTRLNHSDPKGSSWVCWSEPPRSYAQYQPPPPPRRANTMVEHSAFSRLCPRSPCLLRATSPTILLQLPFFSRRTPADIFSLVCLGHALSHEVYSHLFREMLTEMPPLGRRPAVDTDVFADIPAYPYHNIAAESFSKIMYIT